MIEKLHGADVHRDIPGSGPDRDAGVIALFRRALDAKYGGRVERVILFGSRARGDHRPDSDYDIAVFLKRMDGFATESARLAEIETDLLYRTGAVINSLPFAADDWRRHIGLMAELRREGREI